MNTTIHSSHHRSGSRAKIVTCTALVLLAVTCSLRAADARSSRTGPDGRPTGNGSATEVAKTDNKSTDSRASSVANDIRKLIEKQNRVIRAILGLP